MIALSSLVKEIATPIEKMVFVKNDDKFSDLYYRMVSVGVRHCPVIDSRTDKCIRILSRRDLVSKIPPVGLLSEEIVRNFKIDISDISAELMMLGRNSLGKVFPELEVRDEDNDSENTIQLVALRENSTILDAIKIFVSLLPLSASNAGIYLTGLPILSDDKFIFGFVSYTDILKNFIKSQYQYLQLLTIAEVASVSKRFYSPGNDIVSLFSDDTLSGVVLAFAGLRFRSLPVLRQMANESQIAKSESELEELIGFVDDVTVKIYDHPKLAQQLAKLGVESFMTPISSLPNLTPDTKIVYTIDDFLKFSKGRFIHSSFPVTTTQKRNAEPYKQLRGILSYTNILKEYLRWEVNNPSPSVSEDQIRSQPCASLWIGDRQHDLMIDGWENQDWMPKNKPVLREV